MLLRIALHELLIDICPHQTESLFLQILRFPDPKLGNLGGDDRLRLIRSPDPPHFGERVHVKGQIIELVLISCNRAVDKMIERDELLCVLPHFLIRCVENMRAIAVNEDPLLLRAIDIAGYVVSFVDDQTLFSVLYCFMRKDCTVQTCTDDQIVILHVMPPLKTRFFRIPPA